MKVGTEGDTVRLPVYDGRGNGRTPLDTTPFTEFSVVLVHPTAPPGTITWDRIAVLRELINGAMTSVVVFHTLRATFPEAGIVKYEIHLENPATGAISKSRTGALMIEASLA